MDPFSDVISFLQPRNYRVSGFAAGGDGSARFDTFEGINGYAVTLAHVGLRRPSIFFFCSLFRSFERKTC